MYKILHISVNQAQPHSISISISISIQAMEFYILFAIFFRYFIPRGDGRCGWIVENGVE